VKLLNCHRVNISCNLPRDKMSDFLQDINIFVTVAVAL